MDRAWWNTYIKEVRQTFAGEYYTAVKACYDVRYSPVHHYKNSGAAAINLAAHFGAKKILLLGYDCGHTGGKTHWHGDHPKQLGNAGSVNLWLPEFTRLAADLKSKSVEVINCSRTTALKCFARADLSSALQHQD